MTARPHAPIYTPQELAELVAAHDREHPDHGNGCGCENGLISMLRTYFAPAEPIMDSIPPPYVPPDTLQPATVHGGDAMRKPWLAQGDDETKVEYDYRVSHSCYNCGTYIVDRQALNRHEDDCSLQGRRKTDVGG